MACTESYHYMCQMLYLLCMLDIFLVGGNALAQNLLIYTFEWYELSVDLILKSYIISGNASAFTLPVWFYLIHVLPLVSSLFDNFLRHKQLINQIPIYGDHENVFNRIMLNSQNSS